MSNNKKLLEKLLREKKEQDWFDFKSALKLYQSDGKLIEKQRDELLKDILGLANGNSNIIRKTKYLIIGVDDEKFDENGMRVLHDVDYKIPDQSELIIWLKNVASPALVEIESELIPFGEVNLWVITIQPTFDIHETTRELNAKGHFQKHVVFMRRDQHTEPASVREGVTIQQRKQLYRQEISNPPAGWIGAIAGGIVALFIGNAKITASQTNIDAVGWILQVLFAALGIFFGWAIGFFAKQWNETRYDWRYMRFWQRVIFVAVIVIVFVLGGILIR
jgi:hypothetical protein